MNIHLDITQGNAYRSNSQRARVITEHWVNENLYCPNCENATLSRLPNNTAVADFVCKVCEDQFELKSKNGPFGSKIVDGAYSTMIKRIKSSDNPNFILMNYSLETAVVENLFVIPKHFISPIIIEKRRPLAATAVRANWIGCNLNVGLLPKAGKIVIIHNQEILHIQAVRQCWKETTFLREMRISGKTWLIEIIKCIEIMNKERFVLSDIYRFEPHLAKIFTSNNHIKDKIRQQLQFLRNQNYLKFEGNGNYRVL